MNLIQELQERNLIQDIMPGTEEQLEKEMTSAYVGFDPTADSLHVGHLLPITLLMRLQQAGHKPYALVGGATGMIGDPSGKSAERNLLDLETIQKNCDGIRSQLEKFLKFGEQEPNAAVMVNNYDWFKEYSFLDFIREIGKLITVNYMMSKDSVQKRLETGLSFTEFTYQLIQGYDFYYLFNSHDVRLQMGGADQWGNMVTGTELIRKKGNGGEAFAFTCPLITKSDGTKFGKSEGGNVWLDPARTSPYLFYQFWMKLTDVDAERMAFIFSFKPVEEIRALIMEHQQMPNQRKLQKALAEEMTEMVHNKEELALAQEATEILHGKAPIEALLALNEKQLLEVMDGVPQVTAVKDALNEGVDLITFLADRGVFSSKGEARKMIQNGGVSINKQKVTGIDFIITEEHLLNDHYMLIQKGKNYTLAIFS
ncbi:MAG: tyrosine--tRNA ligase [Sphingobacteriales bacterium]|nr:MAG: tyrosine--tRNA ligase [Sphingobacteriales bacterium]